MMEIQALQTRHREEIESLFSRMGKPPPPSVFSPAVAMVGGRRRRKSHRSSRSSGQPSPIHSGKHQHPPLLLTGDPACDSWLDLGLLYWRKLTISMYLYGSASQFAAATFLWKPGVDSPTFYNKGDCSRLQVKQQRSRRRGGQVLCVQAIVVHWQDQ